MNIRIFFFFVNKIEMFSEIPNSNGGKFLVFEQKQKKNEA